MKRPVFCIVWGNTYIYGMVEEQEPLWHPRPFWYDFLVYFTFYIFLDFFFFLGGDISSSSDSILVSDLSSSLSESTTALFFPPSAWVLVVVETMLVEEAWLLLLGVDRSGVDCLGLLTGRSLSSREGTLEWSKS